MHQYSDHHPVAVFGTLRLGCSNHSTMNGVMRWEPKADKAPQQWHKRRLGFLRHYVARDIDLHFQEGASCPFEVFYYSHDKLAAVMPTIDRLESFDPERGPRSAYVRTLMEVHLLPDDFQHELFPTDQPPYLRNERNLKIDPATFEQYPVVECWVYGSKTANAKAAELKDSPIVWAGNF